MTKIAALAALLVALLLAAGYYRYAQPCATEVELPAEQYWAYARSGALVRVKDHGDYLSGRLSPTPTACFSISKKALEEPRSRSEGYRLAAQFFAARMSAQKSAFNWFGHAGKELKKLTGQEFQSGREAMLWLAQNREYLKWSPATDSLVLDEYARRVKPRSQPAQQGQEISAEEYWMLHGKRQLKYAGREGEFRLVQAPGKSENEWVTVKVEEARLENAESKRSGFREAARELLDELLRYGPEDPANDDLMFLLRELTGESFREQAQWKQWKYRNKTWELVLSADGERLATPQ